MRQKTVTERYKAVCEGKMAEREFVRQMRQEYPMHITQFNGFKDSVQILKNRGLLFEEKKISVNPKYDERPKRDYPLDALERGIRYELEASGVDSVDKFNITADQFTKAEQKAKKNLEKDPLHYINLISGESSKVDKHDKEVEIKRGEGKVDVFNGLKKANLREGVEEAEKKELPKSIADKERDQIEKDAKKAKGMIKEDPKENIIAVAKAIREKYGMIPGFNILLKDFLFTHQHEIKAGEVTDPIGEFDNFVDANYDRLDEKEDVVNERVGALQEFISLIQDRAAESGFSEAEEAAEVIEALQDHYNLSEKKGTDHDKDGDIDSDDYMAAKDKAIKKAMGKDEQLKEVVKNIIRKSLEEGVLNEAATNQLADIADQYEGFEGMKQTILALQNIVTEIELFYDKTRGKVQKIYDSIGEVRNEEGLKVGPYLAPAIEAAFRKDLNPVTKAGFTKGLEVPKVRVISQKDIDAHNSGEAPLGESEPKQTIFSPVNEKRNNNE